MYLGVKRQLKFLEDRQSILNQARDRLLAEIPRLQHEFSDYRGRYRLLTRNEAAGEELGTLVIRGGREYQNAVISRVTDVGIEIRHKDGIARIQAPDLDGPLQDRFQWNDEERRARLNEELTNHQSIVSSSVLNESPPSEIPAAGSTTAIMPAVELRAQIIAWRNKIRNLAIEKSQAMSAGAYGKQSSVSGSLETWKSKSVRITREIENARTALSLAKSRLAMIAPDDETLRIPEGERQTD